MAPISGLSSIYANSFNALTSMTCSSLRVNNNAEVLGDVLYGLGPTSLTTTMSGKANLSGATFTGNVSVVGGSYGAWVSAPISATTYASDALFTWGAMTTSNNITHAAGTSSFQVSQAGTYMIGFSILSSGTNGTSGFAQPYIITSPNNSTWTSYNASIFPAQLIYPYSNLTLNAILTLPANTYVAIKLYSTLASSLSLNNAALLNYFYMYRIG